MYYTVKTLLSKGKSQRKIAKELSISRNTVSDIAKSIAAGKSWPTPQTRPKKLSEYHDQVRELVENNKSVVIIHDYLTRIYGIEVSYPTVVRYVRRFKKTEVYVPMLCDPGQEAQVDFGYLGLEAIKKGYKVLFTHANNLIEQLHRSKADGKYQTMLSKINNIDLLIIDELGFRKIPQNGMDDFFEIIRGRYELGSIIITTNRNFKDWGSLFGDNVMASAIIDRIVHHASIIRITGSSYRIKNYKDELTENDKSTTQSSKK